METTRKGKENLSPNEAFAYGSFTASDGTVLPYRYYLPEGYAVSGKSYPLFLYMHGNGSRGTNNTSQLAMYSINTAVYNSEHECIIIAPQCPGKPKEWTLYGTGGDSIKYPGTKGYAAFLESGERYGSEYFCAAAELLDKFLCEYRVDTSRVYLGGGSNGSGAAWNLAAHYPEVFAAAVPIAGCRATEDYVHSVAHRYKNIAIWTMHGDSDSTVPPEGTRVMYSAVKEIGGNIKYTEVVGGNHSNIWRIAADTEGLIDWLFAQRNPSFENTISGRKGAALPTPANPAWNGRTAVWDAQENAGAYKVTFFVDGCEKQTVFTSNNSFAPEPSCFEEGRLTFTVRAFPQNNRFSISGESTASDAYENT